MTEGISTVEVDFREAELISLRNEFLLSLGTQIKQLCLSPA